jgi:hypothetical protein
VRATALAGLVACLWAAVGCDGGARATPRFSDTGGLRLAPAPARLMRECREAGAHVDFPVRCATRFISGVRINRRSQVFPGSEFFAYEALFTGLPRAGTGHVVVGGQARPLKIDSHQGLRAATALGLDRRLGFPKAVEVVGGARVGSAPAVVFRVPVRRARVGPNAGPVIVMWDAGSTGWMVSVHLEQLPLKQRVATALAIADSVGPE